MVMSDELAARNPPLENTLSEKMESCIVTELVSAFKNTTLEKSDDPLTLCPEISREIQSRKLVIAQIYAPIVGIYDKNVFIYGLDFQIKLGLFCVDFMVTREILAFLAQTSPPGAAYTCEELQEFIVTFGNTEQ